MRAKTLHLPRIHFEHTSPLIALPFLHNFRRTMKKFSVVLRCCVFAAEPGSVACNYDEICLRCLFLYQYEFSLRYIIRRCSITWVEADPHLFCS